MRKQETIRNNVEYGAPLLKRLAMKYAGIGLAIAITLEFAAIGAFWGAQYLNRGKKSNNHVVMLKYSQLGPPPSIAHQAAVPKIATSTPMAKPNVGVPVPVPDAQVSPQKTIATQKELSSIVGPVTQGNGSGSTAVATGSLKAPAADQPPPNFVPVQKEPQVIKRVAPKYPKLAQRAGIEGRVIVKIWVGKDGKPHKAIVLKSDAKIFNKPAKKAAMQYRFTPAIMNKGPVAVWVVIPFTFKLKQG